MDRLTTSTKTKVRLGLPCCFKLVFTKNIAEDFQPVTLSVLPMFHVYGLNIVNMPFLHAGGKLVSLPGFEPRTFINALEEYKVRSCTIKS
jgi:acyl-CoA synthetase (AMP-forming)/AMP-acid ligase II